MTRPRAVETDSTISAFDSVAAHITTVELPLAPKRRAQRLERVRDAARAIAAAIREFDAAVLDLEENAGSKGRLQ